MERSLKLIILRDSCVSHQHTDVYVTARARYFKNVYIGAFVCVNYCILLVNIHKVPIPRVKTRTPRDGTPGREFTIYRSEPEPDSPSLSLIAINIGIIGVPGGHPEVLPIRQCAIDIGSRLVVLVIRRLHLTFKQEKPQRDDKCWQY